MGSNDKGEAGQFVVMVPFALVVEMTNGDSWTFDAQALMVDQDKKPVQIDEVQERILDGTLTYILVKGQSHNTEGYTRPALSLLNVKNIATISIVYDDLMAQEQN